jgi:PIN domain nuclease of toxin-antitoxin system
MQLTLEHTLAFEALPAVHKGPFDRLLAAQANVEAAEFVTADPIFAGDPVRVLW